MSEEIQVTEAELFTLAAEMVMENMPVTNKEFNPKDKDECVDELMRLVSIKYLSLDWIKSVASANISDVHCFIDCDNDWKWSVLSGYSKKKHTRAQFIDAISKARQAMKDGNVTIKHKDKKSKDMFNKYF